MGKAMLPALTLGAFAVIMSATTFNVAIVPIMQELDLSSRQAQLLSSAFLGVTVVLAPLSAWFADRFGAARVFISTLLLYILTSVLGASGGDNFGLLILMRIMQGGCAGIVQPLAIFMLLESTPRLKQGRALSIFGFGVVLAPALGPGISGWLVDHYGWQYVSLLGVPTAICSVLILLFLCDFTVAEGWKKSTGERSANRFDFTGLYLLTLLVGGGVLWPLVWELGAGPGLVLAAVWLWLVLLFKAQQRRSSGLLSLGLFRHADFRRTSAINIAFGAGIYGSVFLIPLLLQDGFLVTATTTGNLLLIGGAALAVSIVLAGYLVDWLGARRILIVGMVSFTLSCILFSFVEGLIWLGVGVVLGRIGLGSIIPSLNVLVVRSVDEVELRRATALSALMRQAGGVAGVVGIGMLLPALQTLTRSGFEMYQVYEMVFLLFSTLFAAGALLARRIGN